LADNPIPPTQDNSKVQIHETGSYWSACYDIPPMPFNWCPSCKVYPSDNGSFVVDDCPKTGSYSAAVKQNKRNGGGIIPYASGDPTDTNSYNTNDIGPVTNGVFNYVAGYLCPGNDYTGGTNHPHNRQPLNWMINGGMTWANWEAWHPINLGDTLSVWWHKDCTNHPGSWPGFSLISVSGVSNIWVTNVSTIYMTNGYGALTFKPLQTTNGSLCCDCVSNSLQGVYVCDPTNIACCPFMWTNHWCLDPTDTNCLPTPPPVIVQPDPIDPYPYSFNDFTNWWPGFLRKDQDIHYPSTWPKAARDPGNVPPIIAFPGDSPGGLYARAFPGMVLSVEATVELTNGTTWTDISISNQTMSAEGTNGLYINTSNWINVINLATNKYLDSTFFRIRKH
jgi:hypothetical protein